MTARRRHRLTLSMIVVLVMVGGVAAAASALTRTSNSRGDTADSSRSSQVAAPSTDSRRSTLPFTRATGRPTRVLFAGDSLTAGFYASSPATTFPALVDSWIGPVDVTAARRADQNLSTVSAVLEVPPALDLAVIELGTNDLGRTDIGDFANQYFELLQRIRSTSPTAAIVCLGLWSAQPGPYDTAIQRLCGAARGVFIPIDALFADESDRGPAGRATPFGRSDTFHPNDRGHRAIAGAIVAELEKND